MIQEVFAQGDSPVHRTDPRCRIAVAGLLSFVIALSSHFSTLWAGLALSGLLIPAARLDLTLVLKRLGVIWGFLLFLWLILPWTIKGEVVFSIGSLGVTREGLLLCAKISIKSNAILMGFIALVATMDFSTLGYALNAFRLPKKLVHLLLLTYRYVFVIEQEYRRLVRAAKIRGFKPGSNLHTYRTYAYMTGMLFVRASLRAERVYRAMKCRGFSGQFHCLHKFALSRSDRLISLTALACIGLLIVMEVQAGPLTKVSSGATPSLFETTTSKENRDGAQDLPAGKGPGSFGRHGLERWWSRDTWPVW